jgi:hypothetical protein
MQVIWVNLESKYFCKRGWTDQANHQPAPLGKSATEPLRKIADPRQTLHVGLITAELLTNASKYAHPPGLPVQVHIC